MMWVMLFRVYSRFAPSQWEMALLCNDISHWLGAALIQPCHCWIWIWVVQFLFTSHPNNHACFHASFCCGLVMVSFNFIVISSAFKQPLNCILTLNHIGKWIAWTVWEQFKWPQQTNPSSLKLSTYFMEYLNHRSYMYSCHLNWNVFLFNDIFEISVYYWHPNQSDAGPNEWHKITRHQHLSTFPPMYTK